MHGNIHGMHIYRSTIINLQPNFEYVSEPLFTPFSCSPHPMPSLLCGLFVDTLLSPSPVFLSVCCPFFSLVLLSACPTSLVLSCHAENVWQANIVNIAYAGYHIKMNLSVSFGFCMQLSACACAVYAQPSCHPIYHLVHCVRVDNTHCICKRYTIKLNIFGISLNSKHTICMQFGCFRPPEFWWVSGNRILSVAITTTPKQLLLGLVSCFGSILGRGQNKRFRSAHDFIGGADLPTNF